MITPVCVSSQIVHSPLNLPSEIDPDLQNLLRGLLCKGQHCLYFLCYFASHLSNQANISDQGIVNLQPVAVRPTTRSKIKDQNSISKLYHKLFFADPSQRMTLDAVANHPWVIRDCEPISRTPCRCKSVSLDKEIKGR